MAVAEVPDAEVEVRGVDSHAVAAAVVFLAGSAPRVLATQRASSEKPGLMRSLTAKGMLSARRPVSATPLETGSETLSRQGIQPVKRLFVVKPTALAREKPTPKAREMPSAKAHLLLSIRPKGRIEGHRRQWFS